MRPSDFFVEQEDLYWDLRGTDPWRRFTQVFNLDLIERVQQGPIDGHNDLDIARGLARLIHDELLAFGTKGDQKLDNEEIEASIRSLRSLLKRLGITFNIPFRDFNGFLGYWSKNGMSGPGGWAARRGYLQELFEPVLASLEEIEDARSAKYYRGVNGDLKNIIFASTGLKPEIVLLDAINNIIEVTKNAESCLFYDRPLENAGLTWGDLVDWWRSKQNFDDPSDRAVGRHLYTRLALSLDKDLRKDGKRKPETILFKTYCKRYGYDNGMQQPALIPQVYLHYDPHTRRQRGGKSGKLPRERMDFLLLFPNNVRIVLEVDGKQHYADGNEASPRRYSEMVAEDRRLRLKGYEVYRFGGYEIVRPGSEKMLDEFFDELLDRYSIR